MGPPIFSNKYFGNDDENEYENLIVQEVDKLENV
jgi:hypothetical protein